MNENNKWKYVFHIKSIFCSLHSWLWYKLFGKKGEKWDKVHFYVITFMNLLEFIAFAKKKNIQKMLKQTENVYAERWNRQKKILCDTIWNTINIYYFWEMKLNDYNAEYCMKPLLTEFVGRFWAVLLRRHEESGFQ